MHPSYGVPQLHHNQLNIIDKHIQDIKEEINEQWYANNSDEVLTVIAKNSETTKGSNW